MIASLSQAERNKFVQSLSADSLSAIESSWHFWARGEQIIPDGDWDTWLLLAGRGFGKTRTGAEAVIELVQSGKYKHAAVVARTAADVRDTCVDGPSGLLRCCDPSWRPTYEPSKRRLTWPNGARATTFSADQPDAIRGPNFDLVWGDEVAAWRYSEETHDQLSFALRLGAKPRSIYTTTPRPVKIIKSLFADPMTHVTRGSTYDNAGNLAGAFLRKIAEKYEGTALGRQEIFAHILDIVAGALWQADVIDSLRISELTHDIDSVVVGVDPAVTGKATSDETGIVVAGKNKDKIYVLDDRSRRGSTMDWARAVVSAYHDHGANFVIAEANNGGDLVREIIDKVDSSVPVKLVYASKGKKARAEPAALLYEQGKVHHVGTFAELEDQMTTYVPHEAGSSPDRLDALVWAIHGLRTGYSSVVSIPNISGGGRFDGI